MSATIIYSNMCVCIMFRASPQYFFSSLNSISFRSALVAYAYAYDDVISQMASLASALFIQYFF